MRGEGGAVEGGARGERKSPLGRLSPWLVPRPLIRLGHDIKSTASLLKITEKWRKKEGKQEVLINKEIKLTRRQVVSTCGLRY